MSRLALALVVPFVVAVAACLPDQGFEIRVNNPCDHQVTVRMVDYPAGTDPDDREFPSVQEVRAFGSTSVVFIPFDGIVVEVSAPDLGWSGFWIDPKRGELREFTIDTTVCH